MGSINRHFGSVRVYPLVDPAVLSGNARAIARELFGLGDLREGDRNFEVHPTSGYLFYADHGELWTNRQGKDLPAARSRAEALARAFLEDGNRRVLASRRLRAEGVPVLFPPDLRPLWVGRVVPNRGEAADHWLCQFGVFLAADRERVARVEGASIDIRIGRQGRIISLSSRWRPLAGEMLSSEWRPSGAGEPLCADPPMRIRKPAPRTLAGSPGPVDDDSGHSHEEPVELLFWLADQNTPQSFLAPFYLERSGHHGGLQPASTHSLMPEIWQRADGSQLALAAVVRGGSGNYVYQWGRWTHDSLFEEGIRPIGNAPSAAVERGSCHVLLHVRDTLTGAVAQAEATLFARAEE